VSRSLALILAHALEKARIQTSGKTVNCRI
jgi:hypothetical protein